MSLFTKIGDYDSNEELRYRQILAEEEAEEEEYNKTKSFDGLDKKKKAKSTSYKDAVRNINKDFKNKNNEVIYEETVEESDSSTNEYNNYDSYVDDYNSFNTVTEYEEDNYVEEVTLQKEEVSDTSTIDKDLIVSIVYSLYKYFFIIISICACLLILYLLFKARFVAVFLYIISIGISFMFGYIMMFLVSHFIFKDN